MNKKIFWLVAGSVLIGPAAVLFSVRKSHAQAAKSSGYACSDTRTWASSSFAEELNRLNCDSDKPFAIANGTTGLVCCFAK